MIIELPGFEFENPPQNTVAIKPLFDTVRNFLDAKGVNRDEYALGSEIAAGFGELVIKKENDFWLVFTTERGKNFDAAIFSSEFYAINYFIFRLTGDKTTIDWSTV